jgi:hypothetical protein
LSGLAFVRLVCAIEKKQAMPHQFGRRRGFVLLCLPLLPLAIAGCIPEEQWLADSSGFVYSVGTDYETQAIRFYDIVRRAERIVWTGSNQVAFAVDSAEGVLYLIEPRRGVGKPPFSYRLSSYNIKTSQLLSTTRWMNWNGNDPDASVLSLAKLPNRSRHFLVKDAGRGHCNRTAILNAQNESLIDVPGLDLEIIPDGSGFLAKNTSVVLTWQEALLRKQKLAAPAVEELCRESLWFVDLNGVRHRLTWDESALRRAVALYRADLTKVEARPEPAARTTSEFLTYERFKWQPTAIENHAGAAKMTALLGHEQGAIHIDFQRRTITDVADRAVGLNEIYAHMSPRLDSGPSVPLLKLKDVEYRMNILGRPAGSAGHYVASLDVRWLVEGKAKTVLDRWNIEEISMFTRAFPNRLNAVLKFREPDKDKNEQGSRIHFLIVDNAGNLLDRLFFHHFERADVNVEAGIPGDVPKNAK